MRDIPIEKRMSSCVYTDDFVFYSRHPNLRVTTNTLQPQLNSLLAWSKQCRLKINLNKIKRIYFTNRQITLLPIIVRGQPLEFLRFKYLEIMWDSPHLR
ncbi:hypothetical protein FHG87_011195 [Trinorchestia longiramus]|nr:hypothetical protein FHG87_011195 [Trinorchestia longiramus]